MLTSTLSTPPEVRQFRKQFPIFESKIHLATNSKGALSLRAIAAHEEYLESWRTLGAPWDLWVQKHEELKAAFARLIGASPHEIAVVGSATAGLASVASGIDWRGRHAVGFDDFSFPSVTYLWHAQAARGSTIRRVHADPNDEIPTDAFRPIFDHDLRLLSVAHVCYKNGHRLDLPPLALAAHDVGAWLVVDDYQSIGSRRLNVKQVGIDILVAGTVKFLLGSSGVALMYVDENVLDTLHPTITGWFGQRDPTDFQIERHDEAPDASRFQSGTPAIPAVYDSLAGLELLEQIGIDRIHSWIDELTSYAVDALDRHGFVLATPKDRAKRGPQISIRTRDAGRAVEEFGRRGIVVTARDINVRTAWHYYNTVEDVDALVSAADDLGDLVLRR